MSNLIISVSPTVDTNIYASGDLVGGKLTLTDAALAGPTKVVLQAVEIVDLAKQSVALDVVLFGANPSATTFTDNAAFDIDDADLPKVLGVVSVTTWYAFNDNSVGQARGLSLPVTSTGSLYAALVSRATPTFAAATDVTIRFEFA